MIKDMNNISFLDIYIQKAVKKNINVSLSGLFKRFRMKVPLIGDYVILNKMIQLSNQLGKTFNRNQILTACSYSRDFSETSRTEKTQWIEDFLNMQK